MSHDISKVYSPDTIEAKWYQTWNDNGYFKPEYRHNNEKVFSILMPPPNVTGKLHIGHALDHTLQDILIRYKRMQGYKTLWIPGQDHAGIATQAKVEEKIYKEEGKTKHEVGREEFLKKTWEWKERFGGDIIHQLQKLGDSCDWDYFTFTMDDIPQKAVRKFFVDLYKEGLIYQANYIVNWDPVLQSAISDAEVEHREVDGNFYHIKYQVADQPDTYLEIATTRPETLLGDTAVCVNPNDDRYEDLIGMEVIIPIVNRKVKIVADEHVDMDTGTGCLKVTPGHDFNDYEIGQRHNLEIINILNKNGTINDIHPDYEGLTVKEARKKIKNQLADLGILIDTKQHKHQVGHSQRSNEVVEPIVSKQWFINTVEMAKRSVEKVESGEMKFFPKGWENTYFSYQKNPRPWCISRQLWWGHQIPVYYCEDCGEVTVEHEEPNQCSNCQSTKIKQDEDVLDTWFSSGLFPLSTLGWPDENAMEKKGFSEFYPSQTLVTGYDIIFFWVARMMMMCDKVTGKSPFDDVYIHAIVRDKNGTKMSKSLGNVIDPLDVIKDYGCDALRYTLAFNSGYNRNINLDPERIESQRNFVNKLWNAYRFTFPYIDEYKEQLSDELDLDKLHHHEKWVLHELNECVQKVSTAIDIYRFDEASQEIYQFVYEKFCSWFIELSKDLLNSSNYDRKIQRLEVLNYSFKTILKLIHPFTPFISEELWNSIKKEDDELLIIQQYPRFKESLIFNKDVQLMTSFIELTQNIRNLRQQVNLKPNEDISIHLKTDEEEVAKYLYQSRNFLKQIVKVKKGSIKNMSSTSPSKCISNAISIGEVYMELDGVIDLESHKARLNKDLSKKEVELLKVIKKIENPKFINNAPKEVVAEVENKHSELAKQVESIKKMLMDF